MKNEVLDYSDLKELCVLITGATGGIGTELCKAFLRKGSIVFAGFRGSKEKLDPLFSWLKENDISKDLLHGVEIDMEKPENFKEALEGIKKTKSSIDVLINNAGYAYEYPFLMTPDTEIQKVIDINLKNPLLLTQMTMRDMLSKKRGSIINISSSVAQKGGGGRGVSIYAATKAALNRITEVTALEMAKKGIRVNSIAPGAIETKMTTSLMHVSGKHVMNMIPMDRLGQVEEVSSAALFLASERHSSFVTGQTFCIDGGLTL